MPAMVNTHIHFGYERFIADGDSVGDADNYTPENLQDQFQREAFYGVGPSMTAAPPRCPFPCSSSWIRPLGTTRRPPSTSLQPGRRSPQRRAGRTLRMGTRPLHANYEVITSVRRAPR